ncbi:hypothetical protein C3V36_10005 [Lachnospiraceae bacterium oral taxon 500]|nr:hypothetical protein C3V36_10005 [Lachnospiraceae bacterium oral taxon 500]
MLHYFKHFLQYLFCIIFLVSKNYGMLKVIISASSNKGEIITDCFSGSSTTLGVAHELGA